MTARIDVAGPIVAHLRVAEARFEERIRALESPVQTAARLAAEESARRAQNPVYALGQMNAALLNAAASFARAFRQGMNDYEKGIRG